LRSLRDTPIRRKLMAAFALVTGGALVLAAISAGIAIFPGHGEKGEALVRAADAALYEAKAAGRDRVEVFAGRREPT